MKKYIKYISLLVGISGITFGLGFQNRLPLNILLGLLTLGIFGIYLAIVIQNDEKQLEKKEFIQLLNDYFSKNSKSQKDIQENISKIGEMPEQLTLLINNLTDKLENKMENEGEIIEDLTENIEVQIKKLMNSLRDLIDEISDSQDNVSEHTKQLVESYNNFEQFTKNTIEQMTMMTNKDYEFLKGFLNNDGKNN